MRDMTSAFSSRLMPLAEPGDRHHAEQKREREEPGEQREQAYALDVIGVAPVQAEPIAAMHHMPAPHHDEARQGRCVSVGAAQPEAAAAGLVEERR